MTGLVDLRKCLEAKLSELKGVWVLQNSNYERKFADIIGAIPSKMSEETSWDCTWKSMKIEVKKCKKHSWLNLLRYAKYMQDLKNGLDAEPITLFLFHEGKRRMISSISIMTMERLLQLLNISDETANTLIDLNNKPEFKGRLNVQYRLKPKEIRSKANFNIP